MAVRQSRGELQKKFTQGSRPSEKDFYDLFESSLNFNDDPLKYDKDNPNSPLSIIGRGEQSSLLDFKMAEETESAWRFLQKPANADKPGLHITSNAEKGLYLKQSDGFVGLGTVNPHANLEIKSEENVSLKLQAGEQKNSGLEFREQSANSGFNVFYDGQQKQLKVERFKEGVAEGSLLTIDRDSGKVGIGTEDPDADLEVNGDIHAENILGRNIRAVQFEGKILQPSDSRLKIDIQPLGDVLDKVKQLTGVSFLWKKTSFSLGPQDNRKQLGFLADEMEKVFPELVAKNKEGFKLLEMTNFSAVLLEAIKALLVRIETLEGA